MNSVNVAMALTLAALTATAAQAQYLDVRVVRVTSVGHIEVSDGGGRYAVTLPQLDAPRGCHGDISTKWAQQFVPAGTMLKWLPDPRDPRLVLEIAGANIDYLRAALSAGAATVSLKSDLQEVWQPYQDAASLSKIGLWAECSVEDPFERAGREAGIAKRLLYAVALTESGRQGAPFPWTLNVEGQGYFYPSRQDAHHALVTFLKRGARSIDVGIMQVNLLYNGSRFKDTWQALDPYTNIRVAADILKDNFARENDVARAVAHYHSRTPWRGASYLQRVSNNYQRSALLNTTIAKDPK